jgi:hypothetical protein
LTGSSPPSVHSHTRWLKGKQAGFRPPRFGVVIEAIAYSPNSASLTKPRDKAKIEVDAWKKFLQARVFGLTLHRAGGGLGLLV